MLSTTLNCLYQKVMGWCSAFAPAPFLLLATLCATAGQKEGGVEGRRVEGRVVERACAGSCHAGSKSLWRSGKATASNIKELEGRAAIQELPA